jgi:hypothetical protein
MPENMLRKEVRFGRRDFLRWSACAAGEGQCVAGGGPPSRPCEAPTELSEVGSPKYRRTRDLPLRDAPRGEGEYRVFMKTKIRVQVEIFLPPFSARCSLRGANGGT